MKFQNIEGSSLSVAIQGSSKRKHKWTQWTVIARAHIGVYFITWDSTNTKFCKCEGGYIDLGWFISMYVLYYVQSIVWSYVLLLLGSIFALTQSWNQGC